MNQKQFCYSRLKQGFADKFGRELEWGVYVYVWLVYGASIVKAMSEGLVVRLAYLGAFKPNGMVVRVGSFEKVIGKRGLRKKDVEVLGENADSSYLCVSKSKLAAKRYDSNTRKQQSTSHVE